jgi:uracil-DNA glycosylase
MVFANPAARQPQRLPWCGRGKSGKLKHMAKTELEERSKNFALEIIDLVENLPRNRAG